MGKEWIFCLVLLQVIITVPSLITPVVYFVYEHGKLDRSTVPIDIVTVIVSFLLGFLPVAIILFVFIKYYGDHGENGAAKTIRYVLSKLRCPGFWGASIRNESTVYKKRRETVKDFCAIISFSALFIALFAVFYSLVGVVIYDADVDIQQDSLRLLNGSIPYKPVIDPSLAGTRVRVYMDNGEGGVTKNIILKQGTTKKWNEENVVLNSDYPVQSFGYTLTPGSYLSMSITSSSNMSITFKKDDAIIEEKSGTAPSFDLVVNETNYTSYLVNISSPGPNPISISYNVLLEPMVFSVYNLSSWVEIKDHTSFYVKNDEFLILSRSSMYCAEKEYIDFDIQTEDQLPDSLYRYQWTWYCCALYISSLLFVFEQSFAVCLIGYVSDTFVEIPAKEKENKCKVIGHINIIMLLCVGMIFFSIGVIDTDSQIDRIIKDNTLLSSEFVIYTGEQAIFPINDSIKSGIKYECPSEDVKISAISQFPSAVVNETIDCSPGSFSSSNYWNNLYFINEGYSLEWDFKTVDPADLVFSLKEGSRTLYSEKKVNSSKHEITVNETGVYCLDIRSNNKLDLTFNSLKLKAPKYDLSSSTLWSEQESISMKKLEESVQYIVIEPAKSNISSKTVSFTHFEYDDPLDANIQTNYYSFIFTFVFVGLIIIAVVFMILDMAGVLLPFCYITTDLFVGEDSFEGSGLITKQRSR